MMRKAAPPGRTRPVLLVALAGLALAGCGQRVSGTYLPSGDASYQKFEFSSGETVDLTIAGIVRRGTYKMDGKKVVMTIDSQSMVFVVDDKGCIDGGQLIGRYCKQ